MEVGLQVIEHVDQCREQKRARIGPPQCAARAEVEDDICPARAWLGLGLGLGFGVGVRVRVRFGVGVRVRVRVRCST